MNCAAFLLGLAISVSAAADVPPATDQRAQDVIAAIRARLAAVAKNDTATWSKLVADGMMGPLEGDAPSKQAWIRMHNAWPRGVEYWYGDLQDLKVRIDGDTAVATYHAQQFTKVGGQTTSVHKWQIETHVRREGGWLLLAVADGTILPEPTAVMVDPAILDAYVGDYEWAPDLISKIRRHGDSLTDEFAGQGTSDLGAENATTFFIKGEAAGGDSSRYMFVKGADGRVTHYLYRQLGGTDRIVKKIQ